MKIVSPGIAALQAPADTRRSRLARLACTAIAAGWALTLAGAQLQGIEIGRNGWLLAAVGMGLGLTWALRDWTHQRDRSLQVLLVAASMQATAASIAFDRGALVAWPFAVLLAMVIGKAGRTRVEVAWQAGVLAGGVLLATALAAEPAPDAGPLSLVVAAVVLAVAAASRAVREINAHAAPARGHLRDVTELHRRLAAAVASQPQRFAVLTLDLDGLDGADLAAFQRTVAEHVGGEDLVARSSDEGLSIVADTDALGAMALARRIEHVMARLRHDEVGAYNAAIGIAMYPEDGRTPDELLASADAALLAASRVASPLSR